MGIHEIITRLEALRKKRLFSEYLLIGGMLVFLIVPFLGSILFRDAGSTLIPFLFLAFMVALVISVKNMGQLTKEYKDLYKSTFVVKILQEIFTDVNYNWNMGFPSAMVSDMGLCRMGNRFYTEDYLSGRYKGVPFEQADVKVQYHTSGKNSHTTTYFEGRMFVFNYPYKKVFSVQVFSENFKYRCLNPEGFKTNKLEMESADFNKKYDVFAVQDVDGFYVLTPPMMEKIQAICTRYGNIALRFKGDKLFVAINSSMQTFDGNIKRPIEYNAEREATYRDCMVIMDIIDALGIEPEEEPDW